MMKATYDITTKRLIVMGDNIQTLIKTVEEMSEWDTVNDLEGNPLYDIQLDFDDSVDDGEETITNPKNYNLQYVNLIPSGDENHPLTQGQDWRNAEVTIIRTEPFLEVLGVKDEYKFNPLTAKFLVEDKKGKQLIFCASLNRASDVAVSNIGSTLIAIDDNGIKKVISEPTFIFEGKEYVISDNFENDGIVISKDGEKIIRITSVLRRENWTPLKLKKN